MGHYGPFLTFANDKWRYSEPRCTPQNSLPQPAQPFDMNLMNQLEALSKRGYTEGFMRRRTTAICDCRPDPQGVHGVF